jgi:hypothetical protein
MLPCLDAGNPAVCVAISSAILLRLRLVKSGVCGV